MRSSQPLTGARNLHMASSTLNSEAQARFRQRWLSLFSLDSFMDSKSPKRNPLLPALIGLFVVAYFDIRFYFFEHRYIALGSAVVIPIAAFITLFFMRSRFAWAAAVIVLFMIAITLLLTYQLGYMGFPLTWFLGIVDLLLFASFLRYLWKVREPYLRYAAAKEI